MKCTLALAKTILFLALAKPVQAVEVKRMHSCSDALADKPIYTVLNSPRNTLEGWSLIDTSVAEYTTLALTSNAYTISLDNFVIDHECDNRKIQHGILAGKLNDWTHQHSNGFETLLDQDNISYGNITHILIDLKIQSEHTDIPSQEVLSSKYGQYLTAEQLTELDQSKVNLGITLFSEDARDQSTESFNAEYILEVDQISFADQWLRVLIPLAHFTTFTQQNYVSNPVNINDYLDEAIFGFRITPETTNGKQLRNLMGDQWNENIPETFKETSMSLSRIEFLNLDNTSTQ